MSAPVLSIVIPTRNRSQYALPAIRCALSSPDPGLEVVVQDNGDGDELEKRLAGFDDPRLRYRHSRERLDMSANFALGMDLASGDFVTFLGDDDGVNPEVVEAARWAAGLGLDALIGGNRIRYCWPDLRHRYWGASAAGTLEIGAFSGRVSAVDPRAQIGRCLRSGASCFHDLPKIYYGFVKREILAAVKARAGRYFPGPSPDLAGALAVACLAKRVAKVDYPLFVPGTAAGSMGGLGAMKKHLGRLEDFPHLPRASVENWSPLIPRFFSGSTIWGQNAVEALTAMGESGLLRDFNIAKLHARAMVFNPQFAGTAARSLSPALAAAGRGAFAGTVQCAWYVFESWLGRFRAAGARIRPARRRDCVRELPDIAAAVAALGARLRSQGASFRKCADRACRRGANQ